MDGEGVKKGRMANMELLRIVAMLMIVMLHYLSKGEVLPPLTEPLTANGYVAWALECLSLVSVNCYMLISGYFLAEGRFKPGRLAGLWLQVLFYSLLVPAVLTACGVISVRDMGVYRLLQYLLPVGMIQYWFVTAYVLMYLFSPILNGAVKVMSRRQLGLTVGMLLLFLSIGKSVLPVRLEMDNLGYDGVWFICVYLVAAYLRLYGQQEGEGPAGRWMRSLRENGAVWYLAACGILFTLLMAVHGIYRTTGALGTYFPVLLGYNHVLNLLGSIGLFMAFLKLRIPQGRLSVWILRIAPYTFGVYLLHEQVELRFRWPEWLGASAEGSVPRFLLRAFGVVLAVFAAGILADALRAFVFRKAAGLGFIKKGREKLDQWDQKQERIKES